MQGASWFLVAAAAEAAAAAAVTASRRHVTADVTSHSDATSHSRQRSGALTQRQATQRLRYRHMTSQNMAFLGESVALSLHTTSDLSTELCHWLEERDLLYRPVVRRPACNRNSCACSNQHYQLYAVFRRAMTMAVLHATMTMAVFRAATSTCSDTHQPMRLQHSDV